MTVIILKDASLRGGKGDIGGIAGKGRGMGWEKEREEEK